MHKVCSKCKIKKSYAEFSINRSSRDGFQYICKKCSKIINANWYKNNPEKAKAKDANWYKNNPEKVKAKNAKWRKNNLEKARANSSDWRRDNPEKVKINNYNWHKNNPEKCKLHGVKRRARKLGSTNGYMPEWTERVLFGMQEGKCLYCRIDLNLSGIHLEHMVPLSRGGNHNIMNLCLSCPLCNLRKHTMTAEEFCF